MIGRPPTPIAKRFSDKWTPEPNTGCWIWLGVLNYQGYGTIRSEGASTKTFAHRVAYETFVGEIPAGMCVCHRCDVPCCVNPDHLFVGTVRDNQIDMARKSRGRVGKYKYGASQEPGGRWSARVRAYGKQNYVGTFDTEDEAHAAAVAFRAEYVSMVQSQLARPGMRFARSMTFGRHDYGAN